MFAFTFVVVACWEALRPSRATVTSLGRRWFGNTAPFAMTLLITRLLPLLSGFGAAKIAADHGWGLFHQFALPPVIAFTASWVLIDFFGYWTHRLEHKIPPLMAAARPGSFRYRS
jgi:sterol desaturase/sphingolipid hydroxylase (fatty acid hydroxylase superfamily)